MDKVILTAIPIEELLDQFREIVREEIAAERQKENGEKLLSPKEACKIFHPAITLKTLKSWADSDKLKKSYVASRVFYKQSDLIEAAKTLKKYKR